MVVTNKCVYWGEAAVVAQRPTNQINFEDGVLITVASYRRFAYDGLQSLRARCGGNT